jgi:hypothetical protein
VENDVHHHADDASSDGDEPDGAVNRIFHELRGLMGPRSIFDRWVGHPGTEPYPLPAVRGCVLPEPVGSAVHSQREARKTAAEGGRWWGGREETTTLAVGAVGKKILDGLRPLPSLIEYSTNHVPQ